MQLKVIAPQRSPQLAFKVGKVTGATVDPLVVEIPGTALIRFRLPHGHLCQPEQLIGVCIGLGVREPETAAKHQGIAVNPVGLSHRLDDSICDLLRTMRLTLGIE